MNVRRVVDNNFDALFGLGERMREESVVPFPEIDRASVLEVLEFMGEAYFIAVAERDGEAVGFITAQQSRILFNPEIYVTHDILYVAPEARGSTAAIRLIQIFEDWAVEIGAGWIVIGVHTGLKVETTGGFYEKLGYQYMGGNYMKVLK